MSKAGCSFAKYIFEKIASKDDGSLRDALVARIPSGEVETEGYPDSLIIGLPSVQQKYAQLTYMVHEGERLGFQHLISRYCMIDVLLRK
jgi:hypothetical protein